MTSLALVSILAAAVQLGYQQPPLIMIPSHSPDEATLVPLSAAEIASRFSGKVLRYRHGPQPAEGQGLFCPDGAYLREIHRSGLQFGVYTVADGVISVQLQSIVSHPVRRLSVSIGKTDALFARWDDRGWAEIELEEPLGQPCADIAAHSG